MALKTIRSRIGKRSCLSVLKKKGNPKIYSQGQRLLNRLHLFQQPSTLNNPPLSSSNAAAENVIRPLAVGRRNWLFADTPNGAKASTLFYSLVESAKANGLEPWAVKVSQEQESSARLASTLVYLAFTLLLTQVEYK